MIRIFATILLFCASAAIAFGASVPAPIIFFDIAGPDQAKQIAFYHAVFGWDIGPQGTMQVPVTGATLAGALRQDPVDKIIYLGVDDVNATLAQIEQHGGRIVQKRFEVKGVVVLGLFADPAGNSMGLVEMQGQKPKVP